jgi:exopolyphosphatase/guanosine-5'-triphosphate,3'-diphosphate pyrophosphatase
VEIVDGQREARFGFAGAVYGIDTEHGISLDVGGGSLQLVQFHDRTADRAWTFPFGALRLTDQFISADPPKPSELRLLHRHVRRALRDADVPVLGEGELLVGTGGTIRNLAKIDVRRGASPVGRLHGHLVPRAGVRRILRNMSRIEAPQRAAIPGLNSNRADSIVAGATVVDAVMQYLGASGITVSGQGLREGVIRATLLDTLPPAEAVRRSSVRALCRAFIRWNQPHADRRARLAVSLFDALLPDGDPVLREALDHAAQVIDVGATIDVYNRHQRSADVVLESDLQGFSHRLLVAVAAVLRVAERPGVSLKALRPVIDEISPDALEATAALLELADEVERRSPPDASGVPTVALDAGVLRVQAPVSEWWRADECAARIDRIFGRRLDVAPLS